MEPEFASEDFSFSLGGGGRYFSVPSFQTFYKIWSLLLLCFCQLCPTHARFLYIAPKNTGE